MQKRAKATPVRLAALALAAMICLFPASCAAPKVDTAAALQTMRAEIPFSEELTELDTAAICKNYDVTESDLVSAAAAIGSGATAESAAAFEAKDAAAAAQVKKSLETFLADWKEGYADYKPEEVPKLEKAVLSQKGNYVLFCVSADGQKAAAVVKEILK